MQIINDLKSNIFRTLQYQLVLQTSFRHRGLRTAVRRTYGDGASSYIIYRKCLCVTISVVVRPSSSTFDRARLIPGSEIIYIMPLMCS